jgi:iron uptake system component EfeO
MTGFNFRYGAALLLLLAGLVLAACGDSTPTASSAKTGSNEASKQVAELKDLQKSLTETTEALKKNDVDAAKTAFKKFDNGWYDVEEAVRVTSRDLYRDVEDITSNIGRSLLRSDNPVSAEVLPLVQSLEQKYGEAIKQVEGSKAVLGPKQPPISGKEVESATGKVSEYLKGKSDSLVKTTTAFVEAVKSRNIAKSKTAYETARFDYESIEFLAEAFSEFDVVIDARADAFPQGENDPKWTGFHPLEKAIFVDGRLDGQTDRLADQLLKDITALNQEIVKLEIDPTVAISGAAELIEEIQAGKITGEEERYSHTDLNDFKANLQSARLVYDAYSPFLRPRNSALDDDLKTRFSEVEQSISGFFPNGKAVDYTKVDENARKAIAQKVEALADSFSRVSGTLGLKA